MREKENDRALLERVLEIYDQKQVAMALNSANPERWTRETVNRWYKGKATPSLASHEREALLRLLPEPAKTKARFDFIDLFAGIGGLRRAFESIGGRCLLTSEWNKEAVRTYKANYYCDPSHHQFNSDIRDLTCTNRNDMSEEQADEFIRQHVPDHDVLLAGFPCQPFSIAGVSKKNALGRAHGFECTAQGTLFFDVVRILRAKKPPVFVLENVKNLKSHDRGNTFQVIRDTLKHLGYVVADVDVSANDPKIIDGQHFVPQHRERIVLVGFREDLNVHEGFTLRDVKQYFPAHKPTLGDILDPAVDAKYVLTPKLWEYLFNYSITHKAKGNGFGYGLVTKNSVTRTLSARYYKDGSEILVDRGFDARKPLHAPENMQNRPRRLTPRECARLMGYDKPGESTFRIPVSDTQAYKQFGNSVVVPVFTAVAQLMEPRILKAKKKNASRKMADAPPLGSKKIAQGPRVEPAKMAKKVGKLKLGRKRA